MSRLRVPTSLAVAVVGTTATLTLVVAGCESQTDPVPSDAGDIGKRMDARIEIDGSTTDSPVPVDAPPPDVDAGTPDGPLQ